MSGMVRRDAIKKACERPQCGATGQTYYMCGSAISSAPHWNTNATGPQPEQPITLCGVHALEAFGVAFGGESQ